jgi:hypothetical protein
MDFLLSTSFNLAIGFNVDEPMLKKSLCRDY